MDFAMSFACFLSAFEATVPVIMAVPLVIETCTFANAGSWPNLVWSCCVRSASLELALCVEDDDASTPELVWPLEAAGLCDDVDGVAVVSCATASGAMAAESA